MNDRPDRALPANLAVNVEGQPRPSPSTHRNLDHEGTFLDSWYTQRPPEDNPIAPGSLPTVAGYELLAELGRGSMGVVYKARQISLNRLVALKMLRPGTQGQDGLNRFISEARVVARLHHPNIIQIYEISLQHGQPFFAMEMVDGGNLAEHMQGRPQPPRQAAQLLQTLAQAVHAAHEQGIVHRDLKPANILIVARDEGGSRSTGHEPQNTITPKVSDFGLAKQMEQEGSQTQSGMVMGTPNYMAPEQAQGRSRDVGPAADIYALGAILYECLTGRPPYTATSPAETVLLLFQTEPLLPSRLQPNIPRDLESVCLKCLQKDPHRRYATAAELADDLRRFLNGEPTLARPTPLVEQAWKWLRRRPAIASVLGSAAVGLLVLLGLLVWHQIDLNLRLTQARQEEQEARGAEEGMRHQEQLTRLRAEATELIRRGEAALEREDWLAAETPLSRAGDRIGSTVELADLRKKLDELCLKARQQRLDRDRLRRFLDIYNQALLNATLFTGNDLASALTETQRAANEALAVYAITLESSGGPDLSSPFLRPTEKVAVQTGCYELLLILAQATAQPRMDDRPAVQKQRAREALRILDRAGTIGPDTRAFHQRRSDYLRQTGDDTAAHQVQQKALSMKPNSILDHFLLGEELHRRGDWSQAAKTFERVVQEQSSHFWAQYYLALTRLKEGKPDLAAAALTTCVGQRSDFVWVYLLRGAARGEQGLIELADTDFAAAQKLPRSESAQYALHINRGVLRIRQGRVNEAKDDLRLAIALRPRLYQGHVNLAQAYLRDRQFDEAIKHLSNAIGCEPGLAALYRTRARTHLLRRDESAALEDLKQAIERGVSEPKELRAADHLERARLLLRRKDYSAAEKDCVEAVRLKAGPQAYRLQAEALLGQHKYEAALSALDQSVQLGSPDHDTLCARASVRTRLGQYQAAQADYGRALELKPDPEAFAARGGTYLVTDAPRLALKDFLEALRLEPGKTDALVGAGLARALLGQARRGVEDAERALQASPRTSRLYYSAARVFAQAAAHLEHEIDLDRRSITNLRTQYLDRASELLEAALRELPEKERVAFWKTHILVDRALRPLHRLASFQRLAERMSFSSTSY